MVHGGVKRKWGLKYVLGPEGVVIRFQVDGMDEREARLRGERVMAKEWGNSRLPWHFVGVQAIEDE